MRPKYTKKDDNHNQIVTALKQQLFIVIDVANLPGDRHHNPLDLFVLGWRKATEQFEWLQCEVKPDREAAFTANETAYFLSLSIVDPWQASPTPVLAISCADDVLRWFEQ